MRPLAQPKNELLEWLKSSFSSVKLDLKQLWHFVDHLWLLLLPIKTTLKNHTFHSRFLKRLLQN